MTDDGANGYELAAAEFMARRETSGVGAAEVRRWAGGLPRGAAVLDVGCGHGVPISQVLIDEGASVYGIDASPTLVSALRVRFPGVAVECARVEDARLFGRMFDGVVAWGLIFLLQPDTQAIILQKLSGVLHPGGRLLFTAPEQGCTWVDVLTGRPSESLGAGAYGRILAGAGMDVIEQFEDEGQNHYYLAVKRRAGDDA